MPRKYLDLEVRVYGEDKNTMKLKPVRLALNEQEIMDIRDHALDARTSATEIAHAIVSKWLAEHPYPRK